MNNNFKERIENLENRVSALEKALSISSTISGENEKKRRRPAIKEFLNEKTLKTDVDRILAIAVYHDRFIKPDSCFNKEDISNLVKKAKIKKPSNISDTIYQNARKGYFEEDGKGEDGKKKWYVTGSGISIVDRNFKHD